MSNNFKPLPEQAAEKMAADLKAGKSIFHKLITDDRVSQFAQPFNPSTGNNYRGLTALVLLMKDKEDPRWMTLKQASFNRTPVLKGEKATLINFQKESEYRPVLNESGEAETKENGKPKMELVKLAEPVLTNAFLFNGGQLKNMPELKREPAAVTAIDRAQNIIENSKIKVEPGAEVSHYNAASDTVHVTEKDNFSSPELYYSEVLHELAHATAHESRLNRPLMGEQPDADLDIKEELRANIASVLISAELNLPYELGKHKDYVDSWAQVMKDNPRELFNAAYDAQKIADYVLKFDRAIEQKKEVARPVNPDKLVKGDIIPYKDTTYKVLAELKNKVYQMQDTSTGAKFKMGSKDGLFKSLLEARNNPQELAAHQEVAPRQEMAARKEIAATAAGQGLAEKKESENVSYEIER